MFRRLDAIKKMSTQVNLNGGNILIIARQRKLLSPMKQPQRTKDKIRNANKQMIIKKKKKVQKSLSIPGLKKYVVIYLISNSCIMNFYLKLF